MKIWRLECSHGGDPLYTWAFFKNKPGVQMIRNEFVDYTRCIPSTDDLEQLINKGKVIIKSDEFYLEEVEVIENDSLL